MTDRYRDLHEDAYRDWREKRVDEFAEAQHKAFIAGFEAAADESQNFNHLRQWLTEERDITHEQYEKEDHDTLYAKYLAYVDVLVKLSEMGCTPDDTESEGETDE